MVDSTIPLWMSLCVVSNLLLLQFAFNSNLTTHLWYYDLYLNMKLRFREIEYSSQVWIAVWNQNLAVHFQVQCPSGIPITIIVNRFLCFIVSRHLCENEQTNEQKKKSKSPQAHLDPNESVKKAWAGGVLSNTYG